MIDDLDPAQRLQIDALAEEYSRRHGVAVDFLKAEVGPGDLYANSAARVLISPNGAWFECIDLPMEFSGASGAPVRSWFASDEQALKLLGDLYANIPRVTPDDTREYGLFALYARTGIVDERHAYVYHLSHQLDGSARRPREIGKFRPDQLPLVFRCRIDTDLDLPGVPLKHGVVVCLANAGEKNLVVEIPYEGESLHDLSSPPINPTPH